MGKFKHNESFGLISDVSIDSNNNVYVFQRTNPPLLVFNPIGELINRCAMALFQMLMEFI